MSNLGVSHENKGQLDKAIELYEESLPMLRQLKDGSGIGATLNNYGSALRQRGRLDQALAVHKEALELFRQLKDRSREARVLNNLGLDYRDAGNLELATEHFEQALGIRREVKDRAGEAAALANLMEVWKRRGKPRLGIFYGKQAINLYQDIRRDIQHLEKEAQESYVKDHEKTYRTLAELLVSVERLPEAQQLLAMLKDEEFFDFVRRNCTEAGCKEDSITPTPTEAELLKIYREKADRITDIGKEYEDLKNKGTKLPEDDQKMALLYRDLKAAIAAFHKFLKELEQRLGPMRVAGEAFLRVKDAEAFMGTLGDLGRETGEPGRVVAVYTVVTEDSLSLIVVTPQLPQSKVVKIKQTELNTIVNEYRLALQDHSVDPRPASKRLYDVLVAPIAKYLDGAFGSRDKRPATIMWSLDGALRYAPIAALWDGERYMVERYRNTVFTTRSLPTLSRIPTRQWTALGLGVSEKRVGFQELPAVRQELRAIVRDDKVPESNRGLMSGRLLLNRDFTLEAMEAELRQPRQVVHIASHFHFVPGNEDNSYLLLGDERPAFSKLSVSEFKKTFPPVFSRVELLTLSACDTATGGGENEDGSEVEGFGALAQYKGAQSVIATLWKIADPSTGALMERFYKLRDADPNLSKAEVLRQAQLSLLGVGVQPTAPERTSDRAKLAGETQPASSGQPQFKSDPKPPYAHPYYWAPFILIGNWK